MIERIAQVAQSAIETGTAIAKGSKELTPETATRLLEALQGDLDAALAEAVTKKMGTRTHVASDFLVVEDPQKPTTWHLPVKERGKPNHTLMGAAWAALHGGYRGNKYAGPGKASAISKLKALYKSEKMELPSSESAIAEMDKATVVGVLEWLLDQISDEEEEEPETPEDAEGDEEGEPATPDNEEKTKMAELSESASGMALSLVEFEPAAIGARAPLLLDVVLIEPGWGNETDNNYYPREMLEKYANVFEGAKMYPTDHRADDKSVANEVAVITQCPIRFTNTGAPIARVAIHDGNFAETVRNRNALDTLHTLECSILAQGLGRPGFEKDGRAGQLVEAITKVQSVDWVTSAGAGGHAHNLAESGGDGMEKDKEEKGAEQGQEQETQETPALSAETVTSLLAETALPATAQQKLAGAEYADEKQVKEAAALELAYLKEITDSGKPVAPAGKRPQQVAVSEADVQKRFDEIDRQHGLHVREVE